MIALTAELCARAIVAAARSYGDDPLRFATSGTVGRRALTAAAVGIAWGGGVSRAQACRALGVARTAVAKAENSAAAQVRDAITAAREAVEEVLAGGEGVARKGGEPEPPVAAAKPTTWRAPPPLSAEMRAALDAAAVSALEAQAAKQAKAMPPAPAKAPSVAPALSRPRVLTAGAVKREVLARLRAEPATVPDLAAALGVSEAQVRTAVTELSDAREIMGSALTAEGWRVRFWKAVAPAGEGGDA